VHGEAAAVLPLRNCLRIIAWQQATPHEAVQQAPADTRLDLGDGVGVDPGGGMEDDPARGNGVEQAVDDDAVEVQVGIERRAEAVDEDYRAEARRAAGAGTMCAQALLHRAQELAQSSTMEIGVAAQEVAQALGQLSPEQMAFAHLTQGVHR
jgi:hypothetical protein